MIDKCRLDVEEKRKNVARLTEESLGYDPYKPNAAIESSMAKLTNLHNQRVGIEVERVVLGARLQIAREAAAELEAKLLSGDSEVSALGEDELAVLEGHLDALEGEQIALQEDGQAPTLGLDGNDEEGGNAGEREDPFLANGIDPFQIERYVRNDSDYQFARIRLMERVNLLRSIELQEKQYIIAGRYERLQEEVEQYTADMEEAAEAARKRAIGYLGERAKQKRLLDGRRLVQDLEMQLASLDVRQEAFEREYLEEKNRIEQMDGETAELFFAKQDLAQANKIFNTLHQRMAVLQTEQKRDYAVSTVSEAVPARFPVEVMPTKHMAIFGLAAFCVPFGLAFLFEFQHKRVVDPKALEEQLLVPVLGEIARMPSGRRDNNPRRRMYQESVESLRANLAFRIQEARTLLITSAMPSEGKSSISAQLALSLARSTGETVLLIDMDIRDPDQQDLFDLELKPGLCAVIQGEASLDDAIDKSMGPLLHVLPAGLLEDSPHAVLSRKNCSELLDECKKRYSHVIVDSAPVLAASETLAIAAECDATLICAMRDVSRKENIMRAARRLESAGSTVVGAVFSGIPSNIYAYRYGKYHHHDLSSQA